MRTMLVLVLLATPALADGGTKHDFRDIREALVRQMSPEGRYCRECHTRPRIRREYTLPRIPEVPLPQTALLFGTALGGVVIAKKWRRT